MDALFARLIRRLKEENCQMVNLKLAGVPKGVILSDRLFSKPSSLNLWKYQATLEILVTRPLRALSVSAFRRFPSASSSTLASAAALSSEDSDAERA